MSGGVPSLGLKLFIDAEPDEPAEQQVEIQTLHRLPLGAHGIEGL